MSRRAAHTGLIVGSVLVLVAVLAALVVIVTVRYREGLQGRLRANLTSGASALKTAGSPAAFKSLIDSLAAEGISVDLAGITAQGGTHPAAPGQALLTVRERILVNGTDVPATLTASRSGIDQQVHSLEVTEAIGSAVALVLLVALARALVLLDNAVADARASETAMRTFLADASHELRTPVAALHATAERLLRDQPARPARDAIEAQLARESRRLGHLVDDLLNLARLDARETPRRETLDLTGLARAAVATAAHESSTSRVEVITAGPVMASGDPDALLRAMRNLLDNALAVAAIVVIETAQTPHGPTVSVSDNGPGIPPHERQRIFEPFVRLATNPSRGTGLGLAIVQRTIASHGGTITCEPSRSGGARFTLQLPPPPQEPTAVIPTPGSHPAET